MADKPKMFIVRKYVLATCAAEALKKEKHVKPTDVWVDTEWRNGASDKLAEAIGFKP